MYVAFIIDAFSRMVWSRGKRRGRRAHLPIDALEIGVHSRRCAGGDLDGLIHHSERGAQDGFNRSTQLRVPRWSVGARRPPRRVSSIQGLAGPSVERDGNGGDPPGSI